MTVTTLWHIFRVVGGRQICKDRKQHQNAGGRIAIASNSRRSCRLKEILLVKKMTKLPIIPPGSAPTPPRAPALSAEDSVTAPEGDWRSRAAIPVTRQLLLIRDRRKPWWRTDYYTKLKYQTRKKKSTCCLQGPPAARFLSIRWCLVVLLHPQISINNLFRSKTVTSIVRRSVIYMLILFTSRCLA